MQFSVILSINAYHISDFLLYAPQFSEIQIINYIDEVAKTEKTLHCPSLLFEAIVTNDHYVFLWKEKFALESLWEKFKEEVSTGYFIGLNEFLPYPPLIVEKLHLSPQEAIRKGRKYFQKLFESSDFKEFVRDKKRATKELFDDNQ